MQKLVTWLLIHLIFFHERIKFGLFDENGYILDTNTQISNGLFIKHWWQDLLLQV